MPKVHAALIWRFGNAPTVRLVKWEVYFMLIVIISVLIVLLVFAIRSF